MLSAAGNSGVAFDPPKADIDMQGVAVCRGGLAADFSEDELKRKLDAPECEIRFVIRGRGARAGALLDVRLDRRLYSNQRQLPDVTMRVMRLLLFFSIASLVGFLRAEPPKDVLDLLRDAAERSDEQGCQRLSSVISIANMPAIRDAARRTSKDCWRRTM